MEKEKQRIYSKENGMIQVPYADYLVLMNKKKEFYQLCQVKEEVLSELQRVLGNGNHVGSPPKPTSEEKREPAKVPEPVKIPEPEKDPESVKAPEKKPRAVPGVEAKRVDAPDIKADIQEHFNNHDTSGQLFSIFEQYYTSLNEICGGAVRVTMKDGVCSIWNYDEWEEFAFINIHNTHLRVGLKKRYAVALKLLEKCEVPESFGGSDELVCVLVSDFKRTMLKVLMEAFQDVGTPVG